MGKTIREAHNFDEIEVEHGQTFDPKEDRTRQEFKADADVNLLLKKYGHNIPVRPLEFGEVDYTTDLLTAKLAADRFNAAYNDLPDHIRARYGSMNAVVSAIESGELVSLEPPAPVEESQA